MSRLRSVCLLMVLSALGCSSESNQPAVAPENTSASAWRSGTTADETWKVKWRSLVDPIPNGEPFAVEVVVEGDPEKLKDVIIVVDAEMPHHGHGMNFVPELDGEPGHWRARGLLFHMPGRWELSVDVIEDGKMERAQWTVEVE